MGTMNANMNVQNLQNTMMQFEKQSMQMDMKEEMMNDVIDNIMEGSDDEMEQDDVLNQIFEEIGIESTSKVIIKMNVDFRWLMHHNKRYKKMMS
jgi:division protein CdvB (Snf7/Vps24/ESCRT-III family)